MNQDLLIKAINFAFIKHKNQFRKSNKIPYITHPLQVINFLLKERGRGFPISDDAIIAGVLHDTLEDTDTTPEELEKEFNFNVKKFVENESEPIYLKKQKNNKKETWKARKDYTIDLIKTFDKESKLIKCADLLSNLLSLKEDLGFFGEKIWNNFNSTKEEMKWYYSSCIHSFKEGESIKESFLFKQLISLFNEVFINTK